MQAIRIEHSDGEGLWRANGGNIFQCIIDKAKCHDSLYFRHKNSPSPATDGELSVKFRAGKHFCAFKSIEQLQQWVIPEEMKEIIQLGFRVYLLELSECIEGEYQIGYDKACIIKKEDITSLFT